MKFIPGLVRLAAETSEVPELVVVPTQYSDVTVPVFSIVMVGVAAVLLILGIIFGLMFVMKRYEGVIQSLLVGALGVILCEQLLYMLIFMVLGFIPGVADTLNGNPAAYGLVNVTLTALLTILGVVLTYKYYNHSQSKRLLMPQFGAMLGMGVGIYLAAVLLTDVMTNYMNYFMMLTTVNEQGFDTTVAMIVGETVTTEQAAESLYDFVSQNGLVFPMDALTYIMKALVSVSVFVLFYGVSKEVLESKYTWIGIGLIFVYYIPSYLNVFGVHVVIRFIVSLLITGGALYLAFSKVKKLMPKDWDEMVHPKKKSSFGGRRGPGQPQEKMPKIVMPKD